MLGESISAYVPVQPGEPISRSTWTPVPISEVDVRIVGVESPVEQEDSKVFSFGISAYLNGNPQLTKADHLLEQSIPSDALWPNASGTIAPFPRDRRSGTGDDVSRNPWEARAGKGPREMVTAISCGGIIMGGKDSGVAILNDRILRRGDVLCGYSLEIISSVGVAIKKGDLLFVIPLGRHVIIESTGG
jgi:hypothetical protein